jgi:hypothetical protein
MITRYTNIVLTIIALALVTIAVQNSTASVSAQSGVQRVIICDVVDTSHCASLFQPQPYQNRFILAVRNFERVP